VTQACDFSNAPFMPPYKVEIDVMDPVAALDDNTLKGTFDRGTIAVVTTVGTCNVQLKLGQCLDGEQVWINLKALPPSGSRKCTPSVWARIQKAKGGALELKPDPDQTREEGVVVEVLAGAMEDTDGNGVVNKHTNENRLATPPLVVGKLDVYEAEDAEPVYQGLERPGRFFADLEASTPGIGHVRGRVDGAVDAADGMPVGPRCGWSVLAENN
jgi:hypothetical protein